MKKIAAILLIVLAVLALAIAGFWLLADDPEYLAREAAAFGRYGKYDFLISQAARRYDVAPELIKAVIWKESRFHPDKVGSQGERGLMQVTENAAADWARAEKIETFVPTDLFDPKVNIEAGTWYLKHALAHWADKEDPIPFVLAEYNAGRTRVKRWVQNSGRGDSAEAGDLQSAMNFPTTRSYIRSITVRCEYYTKRGDFTKP